MIQHAAIAFNVSRSMLLNPCQNLQDMGKTDCWRHLCSEAPGVSGGTPQWLCTERGSRVAAPNKQCAVLAGVASKPQNRSQTGTARLLPVSLKGQGDAHV